MKRALMLAAAVLLTSGCGSGAIRELSKGESDYMAALAKRVDDHRVDVERLVADLGTLSRQYALLERQKTTTAIAEAKLIESMKAPWAAPPPSLQATQRAVILFHLYELLGEEQARFDAEQSERDAERQKIVDTYAKIATLLGEVISNEKIVLEYANQPAGSQIAGMFDETLHEAHALGDTLAKSSDPHLQDLAAETQRAADRIDRTKQTIEAALNNLNSLKK